MDYLTNYYKNLCEQRQEQIKVLEENLLRRGLQGLGNAIAGGIIGYDKAKNKLGGVVDEIGKGIAGAGQAVSGWGGRKQEEAQDRLERSKKWDPKEIQKRQHEKAITDWMQGGGSDNDPQRNNIIRVLEDAAKHVEGFRSQARWNAYEGARAKHPTKEPKQRKKPYTADEFAKLDADNAKIDQKRRKLIDAEVADFDGKHAANLTLGFIAAELSRNSARINDDEAEHKKIFGTRKNPYTGEEEVRAGREQHSGGHHVGHIRNDPYGKQLNPAEHSDVSAYRKWYEGGGHRIQDAIHPDELFGHHTAHVDREFEIHIPHSGLRAANQRNQKAFESAVQRSRELMAIPDPFEGQISASGGLKTATLRPAFESYSGPRNKFLNDKINRLIEARNVRSEEMSKLEDVIDRGSHYGMKQIYDLSRHPKITDTHKARLSELDELLSSFSGVLGLSDVSEEDLRGIHSDLRDTVKEIHSIRDSLTTPKNK